MDEEEFKIYMEGLQEKAKVIQSMHDKSKKTLAIAQDAGSYQSQKTGALLTIAEALVVRNEFELAGIEEQLKMAIKALADE